MAGPGSAVRTGTVLEFDEARGLGTLAGAGGERWPFHCTAIADGSRRIEVGTAVAFVVGPGPLGRDEAKGLVPLVR